MHAVHYSQYLYIYSGLLEILVNINNHKHYLIINAKFHSIALQ